MGSDNLTEHRNALQFVGLYRRYSVQLQVRHAQYAYVQMTSFASDLSQPNRLFFYRVVSVVRVAIAEGRALKLTGRSFIYLQAGFLSGGEHK